jgi:hypothetical protein
MDNVVLSNLKQSRFIRFLANGPSPRTQIVFEHQMKLLVCVMLACLSLASSLQLDSCSGFQAVQGVDDAEIAVVTYSVGIWDSSRCSNLHSKSVLVMPYSVSIGTAICSMFSNDYPWAGIYYNYSLANGTWIWADGKDISSRPAYWASWSGGLAPIPHNVTSPIAGMTTCGQISCGYDDGNLGKLYDGVCSKQQRVICQVNRKSCFEK